MINLDNLFFIIKEKGLSASKVSDDTGISTGNISDWKKGRSMPTAAKLDILANYLDCSVDYLLGRTDRPENSQSYSNNSISNSNNIAFGENSSVKITNEEIEKEICKILSGLNLRERSELLTIIYNFVDEHKSEELK